MSILQHASFNAYLWWSAALLQNLVHGEPKLEICLDNQYVHVFSWLASHTVCSFAQEHSEMRQLRHQNHHLKQQLEQHRDSMVKMQDTMDVMAFQMNKMGTVNRDSWDALWHCFSRQLKAQHLVVAQQHSMCRPVIPAVMRN